LSDQTRIHGKVKLYVYHASQCDPKKCTALKLLRLGLAKRIDRLSHISRSSIVLDPFSNMVLTKDDQNNVIRYGLVAVDCSWENAGEIFKFRIRGRKRRLREMLAGNPINYGVWNKLSTVEAFAGALIECGEHEQADELLSKFGWGKNFLELNRFEPKSD